MIQMTTKLHIFPGIILATFALHAAAETVTYNRDVRPVLAENCFKCHGPDEADREAGLRLDDGDAARSVFEPDSEGQV